jgi:hypothetical protein
MSDVDPPDPTGPKPRETDGDPFGDVLPERSRDEEPDAWGEREDDADRRLRDEVPPHHA